MAAEPSVPRNREPRWLHRVCRSCKWKEKVAAFGRDTCRFLPRIARKVTLPITHPEEILAVIPKEEAIHCHHVGKYVTLPASPSGRINETGATHDQTP